MNAFDALMWRAEGHQGLRSPVLAVEELDTVPAWDRFLAAHQKAVRMAPRLRQRVVEAPLGLGTPRWSDDPDFDLCWHVRRARLGGGGWSELLAAAAALATSPFDRTRPPWEAVLYEGLPDGRGVYLLKVHHSFTDGLGVAALLGLLHSPHRETNPDSQLNPDSQTDPDRTPVSMRRGEQTSGWGVLGQQVRTDLESVPDLLHGLGAAGWAAVSDPTGAAGAVGAAARYGLSLRRVLGGPDAQPSPLLAGRGPEWRFAALDVPLGGLRAAAKAAGATINDAYLAALLGGYRLYHAALGAPVQQAIPVAVPVSVRRRGDPLGGNRIAGVRVAGPVATTDPKTRINQIRAQLLAAKSEPAFDTIALMSPALARLPGTLSAPLAASMTTSNDLQATLVPGTRKGHDLYLAGARVQRAYPYAPLPGCPAMISMVAHGDVGCVGVNLDPAAITEPEVFTHCLIDGFAEVLSLHPAPPDNTDPTAPTSRT
jgi:WS/DGAT/MGAT family acyltransferase